METPTNLPKNFPLGINDVPVYFDERVLLDLADPFMLLPKKYLTYMGLGGFTHHDIRKIQTQHRWGNKECVK